MCYCTNVPFFCFLTTCVSPSNLIWPKACHWTQLKVLMICAGVTRGMSPLLCMSGGHDLDPSQQPHITCLEAGLSLGACHLHLGWTGLRGLVTVWLLCGGHTSAAWAWPADARAQGAQWKHLKYCERSWSSTCVILNMVRDQESPYPVQPRDPSSTCLVCSRPCIGHWTVTWERSWCRILCAWSYYECFWAKVRGVNT